MSRLEREHKTIRYMIELFCKDHHKSHDLCNDCTQLWQYANIRLDRCTYADEKPVCAKCPIHCYKPEMKERIRIVMRYSGPRMMLYHPYLAFMHILIDKRIEVKKPTK